jgi:hypothetical protein
MTLEAMKTELRKMPLLDQIAVDAEVDKLRDLWTNDNKVTFAMAVTLLAKAIEEYCDTRTSSSDRTL